MSLTAENIKKIAHLAQLTLSEEEISHYTQQLSDIFTFMKQMDQADTSPIDPLIYPIPLSQRLRADKVTESNQRQLFQAIAPQVEAGLYLVPQVIEGEE